MTAISPDADPATRGDIERAMHAQTRWIIGAAGATAAVTVAILRLT